MGVEYARWLVAKGSYFMPEAPSIVKFVEALRAERWIVDPATPELGKLRFEGLRAEHAKATGGYAVRTVENTFGDDLRNKLAASTEATPVALSKEWLDDPEREELRLVWPVVGGASSLRYPLSLEPGSNTSYTLEVHRALEYVHPVAENLESIATLCACGEDLAFEWDDEELVPAFADSTGIFAECEECSRTFDPTKGTALLANPFDQTGEEVRGGAAYRFALKIDCGKSFVADPRLTFAPELVALVEKQFGRSFHEFGALY
jgi:hypothetical protein